MHVGNCAPKCAQCQDTSPPQHSPKGNPCHHTILLWVIKAGRSVTTELATSIKTKEPAYADELLWPCIHVSNTRNGNRNIKISITAQELCLANASRRAWEDNFACYGVAGAAWICAARDPICVLCRSSMTDASGGATRRYECLAKNHINPLCPSL